MASETRRQDVGSEADAREQGTLEPPPNAVVDYVVGIGSSAGGLESLQIVVRGLPQELRVAYIVAQHVAPQHRSLMAELLDRETELEVLPAEDGRQLEPGRIPRPGTPSCARWPSGCSRRSAGRTSWGG